jgi:hypothetical protein
LLTLGIVILKINLEGLMIVFQPGLDLRQILVIWIIVLHLGLDFSHLDHGVAVRTRFKSQIECYLSVQGSFFPLHDVVFLRVVKVLMMKHCN